MCYVQSFACVYVYMCDRRTVCIRARDFYIWCDLLQDAAEISRHTSGLWCRVRSAANDHRKIEHMCFLMRSDDPDAVDAWTHMHGLDRTLNHNQ